MSIEVISIVGLVVVFLIATLLPVNMGALALGVAFAVGTAFGETPDQIIAGFPGNLFLILVGATLLFAIARENGTIDWLVHKAVTLSGGSIAVIPWIMFGVTTLMTAFGAVGPAAVAIVAPIAMAFAARYKIQPVLMGLMVANGASAGGFSPVGVFGGIVDGVVKRNSLPADPLMLFLGSLLFNIAICAVAFLMFGGREFVGKKGTAAAGPTSGDEGGAGVAAVSLNPQRILTLVGILGVAAGVLIYDLDMGFLAISVAALLSLAAPYQTTNAVNKVAWSTVLLICGIVTYVGVMERIGTIDYAGNGVAGIGPPLISAILICFIAAIFSAFGSTTALLGVLIPLAVPFLLKGDVGVVGLIVALCISASVVDASPFSTSGALVVANSSGDSDRVFRQLRAWGFSMVVVAPVVSWLIFVVPGWL